LPDTPVAPTRTSPQSCTADREAARADTTRSLVAWLEAERERYRSFAVALGIPVSISHDEMIEILHPETGTCLTRNEVQISPLHHQGHAFILNHEANRKPAASPASELYDAYGVQCSAWSPFADFESDPVDFIDRWLLSQLRSQYLRTINSLDGADLDCAQALASRFIAFIEGETLDFVCWLPISGLEPTEQRLEVGDVVLRALTSSELAVPWEEAMHENDPDRIQRHLRAPSGFRRAEEERFALEVRTSCSKHTAPSGGHRAHAIVLALQILGFEPHGCGQSLNWAEPISPYLGGSSTFRLPSRGTTKAIDAKHLNEALELTKEIPPEIFSQPHTKKHIVFHRFQLGAAEDSPADSLIDHTIALEAMFLQKGQDLTLRLQLLGALFIGQNAAQRQKIQSELREIYKVRSELVHGEKVPDDAKVRRAAQNARRLCATALLKALQTDKWPDPDALLQFPFADTVTP
jgi:hypothetical protein